MPTNECESLILEDTNGGILKPKPDKKAHLITFEPSLDFLAELSQVASQPLTPESFPQRFREVLSLIYSRNSSFYPVKYQFRPELDNWQPLRADYTVGLLERISHVVFRQYTEFFHNYDYSSEEKRGLLSARDLGARVVLTTGIEYGAKAEFKQIVKFVQGTLHPDLAVIMTPDGKVMSGVHTKMATTAILGKARLARVSDEDFYTNPEQYTALGNGMDVYPRDDDFGVLSWLSYHFGIRTYCTLPMEQATKQTHLKQVGAPDMTEAMIKSGRVPISDPDMTIMLRDVADQSFHNHPIIRVDQNWQPQYRPKALNGGNRYG